MSDLSVTAASCVPGADADIAYGFAGETITAGKLVYKDTTTSKWMLADNNSATAAARVASALALTGSSLNQPIAVQKHGSVTLGATLTPGVAYYLSATAGGICPVADLTTGMYPESIGMATSASVLALKFNPSGVAL